MVKSHRARYAILIEPFRGMLGTSVDRFNRLPARLLLRREHHGAAYEKAGDRGKALTAEISARLSTSVRTQERSEPNQEPAI